MREPSEALDYLLVAHRVGEKVLRPDLCGEPSKELYREPLVFQLFAVLEGQIDKQTLKWCKLPVVGVFYGEPGDLARKLVRRIRLRVPTEHIARELIQDYYEGEAALRLLLPAFQPPRSCLLVDRPKPIMNLAIKPGILCEPFLPEPTVAFFSLAPEPEVENLSRRRSGA